MQIWTTKNLPIITDHYSYIIGHYVCIDYEVFHREIWNRSDHSFTVGTFDKINPTKGLQVLQKKIHFGKEFAGASFCRGPSLVSLRLPQTQYALKFLRCKPLLPLHERT